MLKHMKTAMFEIRTSQIEKTFGSHKSEVTEVILDLCESQLDFTVEHFDYDDTWLTKIEVQNDDLE